jgi:hypothetical protein
VRDAFRLCAHCSLTLAHPAVPAQALLAREDQAGGRKRVGAPLLTMFSGSVKMVGKMRIRLSTLRANTPLNLSMPLQGKVDSTIAVKGSNALTIHACACVGSRYACAL